MANKKGFTLIELLVVIAIIAILAAILFPVFASAKEKGKQATCLNNLKQVGAAVMQYTSDNNNRYPALNNMVNGKFGERVLETVGILDPYVKSAKVWECPSSNKESKDNTGYAMVPGSLNISYVLNGCLCYSTVVPTMSQVSRPARIIWAYDLSWFMPITYLRPEHIDGEQFGWPWMKSILHSEGANYVYADGHAGWMKLSSVDSTMFGLTPKVTSSQNFYVPGYRRKL